MANKKVSKELEKHRKFRFNFRPHVGDIVFHDTDYWKIIALYNNDQCFTSCRLTDNYQRNLYVWDISEIDPSELVKWRLSNK
jgi:hypothetical protein